MIPATYMTAESMALCLAIAQRRNQHRRLAAAAKRNGFELVERRKQRLPYVGRERRFTPLDITLP